LATELQVGPLPASKAGYFTFGSLNNYCKMNAEVVLLWAGVLRGVEHSRLILLAPEGSHRQTLLETFQQQGVAPERITLVSRRPRAEYLKLYNEIDIGLDTIPYSGQTTSLDAFWMGVPVVTIAGQTAVGRAGLSLLTNLGLPELVAESPADFTRIAMD